MPKRSRENHVTLVDGKIHICASGIVYFFNTIRSWEVYEVVGKEGETDYILNVSFDLGDRGIKCMNEDEMRSIADQLLQYGF